MGAQRAACDIMPICNSPGCSSAPSTTQSYSYISCEDCYVQATKVCETQLGTCYSTDPEVDITCCGALSSSCTFEYGMVYICFIYCCCKLN